MASSRFPWKKKWKSHGNKESEEHAKKNPFLLAFNRIPLARIPL
jgi:hypothetical protein